MKSYRIYEELIEQIPDATFIYIKKDNHFIVNQQLARLFGFKNTEEFRSQVKERFDLIHENYISRVRQDWNTIDRNPGLWSSRYCFKRKDGSLFHAVTLVRKFSEKKSEFYSAIYGTIKEKSIFPKQVVSSDQSEFFLNNTNEIQVIFNMNGGIQMANHKFYSLDFFADKNITDLSIYDIVRKDYHKKLLRRLVQLRKGIPTSPAEYILCNGTGKQVHVEMYSKLITINNQQKIITSIRDITIIKEAERKLIEAVIQTEEKERNRIAEDLHDELGPFLSGLKLYIDELAAQGCHNSYSREMIKYLKVVTDEATSKVREITRNLRSEILMNRGLAKALEIYIDRFNLPSLAIELDTSGLNIKRNTTLELLIYRIAIELINNTIKHAQASAISIKLSNDKEKLFLHYYDNGKGYNLKESITTTNGIGLHSIINRVKSLKGKYSFSSNPVKGTQLNIQVPLI